jgi:hypothetical protein
MTQDVAVSVKNSLTGVGTGVEFELKSATGVF